MSKFESRIKELRLENGLTYAQLASEFGKSEGAIRAWESGRTNPDIDTVIALAKKFDVSTDYLLGTSDARIPEDIAFVAELGLTHDSIKAIKRLSARKEAIENDTDKHDERSLLDVFNQVSVSSYFDLIMHYLKNLTNPDMTSLTISQFEGEPYASVYAQKDESAKAFFYEKMLYESIDDLITDLRTEVGRAKIGKIDIFSDERKE